MRLYHILLVLGVWVIINTLILGKVLCSSDEGRTTTTLNYKNITFFILLGVKASIGVRETERWIVIATLTHKFSWPYHTVIFKDPLSTSSASWLGGGNTQQEACGGLLHQQGAKSFAGAPVTDRSLLAASCNWLKTHSVQRCDYFHLFSQVRP